MKTCNKCKEQLPLTEFNKNASRKDGLTGACRPCLKTYYDAKKKESNYVEADRRAQKRYNAKPGIREQRAAKWRERYANDPEFRESVQAKNRAWRAANRERVLASKYRTRYKLSKEAYAALSKTCEICGAGVDSPRNHGKKRLSIDHSHTEGFVRGALCATCNFALGGFSDSIELLQAAIEYLSQPPLDKRTKV